MNNNFLCTGMTEDCHKCPQPRQMNEQQLHGAILRGEKEECVNHASQVYAQKIARTISK